VEMAYGLLKSSLGVPEDRDVKPLLSNRHSAPAPAPPPSCGCSPSPEGEDQCGLVPHASNPSSFNVHTVFGGGAGLGLRGE
jgi:hypothetical protein